MLVRQALIRAAVMSVVLIALAAATLQIIGAFDGPEPELELLKATVEDVTVGAPICLMTECARVQKDLTACLMSRKLRIISTDARDCAQQRLEILLTRLAHAQPAAWPIRVGAPI